MKNNKFGVEVKQTPPKATEQYSFPEYHLTITASSRIEAEKKLRSIIGEKGIK